MATTTVIGNVVTAVKNNIATIKSAIGNATTSAAGLMTTAQVTKLNDIATGANKTTIVNNLTATTAGSALDAVQGKALSDSIASLNSSLAKVFKASTPNVAWKDAPGIYYFESCDMDKFDLPYKHVFVLHMVYSSVASRGAAIAIRWAFPSDTTTGEMWIKWNHSGWSDWQKVK